MLSVVVACRFFEIVHHHLQSPAIWGCLKKNIKQSICTTLRDLLGTVHLSCEGGGMDGLVGELFQVKNKSVGAAVASWLVRSSPSRAARFRALAGVIALCSWARHFTLTVPLSTQVYKWVPANLMPRVTLRWTSIPSSGE